MIFDKRFTIYPNGFGTGTSAVGVGPMVKLFRKAVKINRYVRYEHASANVTNNQYYFFLTSSQGTANVAPVCHGFVKIKYRDS